MRLFVCVSAASFPCARPLLPSSDRSAGQRNQPSHSTVLARPVCPFVCVRAASFPCRFLDLGLNFLLASAYCTRAHRLSLDSSSRPTAGNSSSPTGLSTLVYAYVVDRAPASPYTYSYPHTGFPMSAHLSSLHLFQQHLRSLVWVWVWVWDWIDITLLLACSPLLLSTLISHVYNTLFLFPVFTSVWWSD